MNVVLFDTKLVCKAVYFLRRQRVRRDRMQCTNKMKLNFRKCFAKISISTLVHICLRVQKPIARSLSLLSFFSLTSLGVVEAHTLDNSNKCIGNSAPFILFEKFYCCICRRHSRAAAALTSHTVVRCRKPRSCYLRRSSFHFATKRRTIFIAYYPFAASHK